MLDGTFDIIRAGGATVCHSNTSLADLKPHCCFLTDR